MNTNRESSLGALQAVRWLSSLGSTAAVMLMVTAAAAQLQLSPPTDSVTPEAETPEQIRERLMAMPLRELLDGTEELIDEGEIEKALARATVARERDPENPRVRLLLGEALLAAGNVQNARPLLLDVFRLDENNYRANLALGKLWLQSRVWRQAETYLSKAVELAPAGSGYVAQRLLAEAYLGSRQLSRARDVATQAAQRARNTPLAYDAQQTLVLVLLASEEEQYLDAAVRGAQGLEQQAAAEFQRDPGSRERLERLVASRQLLLEALQAVGQKMFLLGPDQMPTDQPQPGREAELAAVSRRVADVLVLQAGAQRLLSLHNVLPFLDRALEFTPESASLWRDRGLLLFELNRFREGVASLERALELDPDDQVTRERLDGLRSRMGAGGAPEADADDTESADAAQP